MSLFSIAGLTLSATCFLLTSIILIYRKSILHLVWALFNIAVGLWGIGAFFIGAIKNGDLSLLVWRLTEISVAFIAVFFYHVTHIVCNISRKEVLYFAYIQGIIFSIASISSALFFSGARFVFGSFYYATPGPLFYLFFPIWSFLVGYSHYCLFIALRNSRGKLRNQLLYFAVGTILGFSGGITNFFPHFKLDIYPFGNFTIPLYCIIVTYAVLRYKLLDITIAITRTGIFIVTYSLVLGIPFIIASVFRFNLASIFGDKWWLVPMGLLTALATVGPFIYIYINRKAEDRLLREQRKYQYTLRKASGGMIRVRNLKKLLNLIVGMITRTVKIEFAAIFLFDSDNGKYKMVAKRDNLNLLKDYVLDNEAIITDYLRLKKEAIVYEEVQSQSQDKPRDANFYALEKQLRDTRTSVVIPSFVGNNLLGFLVLGKKLSGKIYSQDDLDVFSVLANQAALAVENAQFYEDIKETQEQLFQAEKMATIGTMADGLSHQVNNRFHALTVIAGDSLDILQNTDISNCSSEIQESFKQLKYAFERIQMNVKQGGEIVKGLLKYSRPGQKGFEFVGFNKVIDGALEMAQYKVKVEEVDMERHIPEDLPKIKCNLTQLEEVFFNLIDNAHDAIKERKETLKEGGS